MRVVPETAFDDGEPAVGTYRGRLGDTSLQLAERNVPWLRQALSEKRWQWFSAFGEECAVGGALVDGGFFATGFVWVFDRQRGELIVDEDVVIPSPCLHVSSYPTVGVIATLSVPGYHLQVERERETLVVSREFWGTSISLAFEPTDSTAVTAICPVSEREGGINITQKEPAVPVRGTVTTKSDNRQFTIGGTGFLDYSHGLLGRETRWDWAFLSGETATGKSVACNLVARFNDGIENVIWEAREPRAVGTAEIIEPDTPGGDWQISTACGTVDVRLAPEGARSQDVNIGLVRSRYHQPLGTWEGTIAGHECSGVGVTETHLTRW